MKKFLDEKPLYYEKIDYTRMPRVYERVKKHFLSPKLIHLVGTNGKGTTGRFLASSLHSLGYSVGHYTSPHIANFNERIWLNGSDVLDDTLEKAHQSLLQILTPSEADSLSYFEYTTFLAMYIYRDVEYVVLEAGLGGEHDATAVFNNILTLITPIERDHEAFLGNRVADITATKVNAVQKHAIFAKQVNEEVYEVAYKILEEKNISYTNYATYLDANDKKKIVSISQKLLLRSYLVDNLQLAIAALKYLKIEYSVEDFNDAKLFGRLTFIEKNIIVDVGHNVLAAKAILKALHSQKFTLVYNSYKDKNYKEILTLLKPIVKEVQIIPVDDVRAESIESITTTLDALDMEYSSFSKIEASKKYLVFGSFSVVEAFLKAYNE